MGVEWKYATRYFEAGISEPYEMRKKLQNRLSTQLSAYLQIWVMPIKRIFIASSRSEEKLKLFKQANVLIYNSDNKVVDISIAQSGFKGQLFSWGKGDRAILKVFELKNLHIKPGFDAL